MTVVTVPVTETPARRRPPTGGRAPLVRRAAGRILGKLVGDLLVLLAVVAFSGLVLGPNVLGYRTETMLTGSMAPLIKPGDVVVVATKPAAQLAVGDMISYTIPVEDHRVVTHRVTEVRDADGQITFRTKGDANPDADPWTATVQGPSVWTVRGVVPFAGTALRALRHPVVSAVARWWVPGLLALVVLLQIWRRTPGSEETASKDAAGSPVLLPVLPDLLPVAGSGAAAPLAGPRRRPRIRGPRGLVPPGKHRAA